MGRLEELEARYGVAPAAPAPSRLAELEAQYGTAAPTTLPVVGEKAATPPAAVPGTKPVKVVDAFSTPEERGDYSQPSALDSPELQQQQKDWDQSSYLGKAWALLRNRMPAITRMNERVRARAETDPELANIVQGMDKVAESRKRAGQFGAGAIAGTAVTGAVANKLAPLVTTAPGRIASTAIAGSAGATVGQAAGDAVTGVPLREIPERAADAGAIGSVLSGAGAVATEAANSKLGQAAIGWVRDRYGALTRQLASRGADATHAVRAFGDGTDDAKHVLSYIDRHPEIDRSLGSPSKVREAVQESIDATAPVTAPIYAKVDKAVGEMPVKDVVALIDQEIKPLKVAGKEPYREALEDLKANVLREQKELGTKTWTHQRLRQWVTSAVDAADKKYGSLAGTTGWEIADNVQQVADNILKTRLKVAGMVAPELAPDLATLQAANTDISAGVKLRQLAQNAEMRSTYSKPGGGWNKAAAGAAALALGTSGGVPAAIAWGTVKGAQALTSLPARREATRLVVDLARAVADGRPLTQYITAATAAGVPQDIIDKVTRGKQTPAEVQP